MWWWLEIDAGVGGYGYLQSLPDVITWIQKTMFGVPVEVNDNFNADILDRADEEFNASSPVEIFVRWNTADDLDLNGLVFDINGNLMEVA